MIWSTAQAPAGGSATADTSQPAALQYKRVMDKVDLRTQYTFFTYTVRTSDNVELALEGTIFWQVVHAPQLLSATQDPVYVVYYRARSSLASAVSKVTLQTFMAGFGDLVNRASLEDAAFYASHGLTLNTLEVTSYTPKEANTALVLQQIIQETTNRINRLEQQKSANEVEAQRIQGQVEQERNKAALVRAQAENRKLELLEAQQSAATVEQLQLRAQIDMERNRSKLVQAKAENDALAATAEGDAQGIRFARSMARFFGELADVVPNASQRLQLFQHLNALDIETRQLNMTTANLGGGSAQLFLTPDNLNLRLAVSSLGSSTPLLDDDSGTYQLASAPPPPPA